MSHADTPPYEAPLDTAGSAAEVLGQLQNLVSQLQEHIEVRANGIAAPRINAAEERAAQARRDTVQADVFNLQRLQDQRLEMGRQVRALESGLQRQRREFEDLLGSISLYISWRYVTKQLTTPQKERFADAVDAWTERIRQKDGEEFTPVPRCWRADYQGPR